MTESKWEKFKKYDTLKYLSVDEVVILLLGFFTFLIFQSYKIVFIIFVILWYWLKIRHCERKIIEKEREIYNVHWYNNEKVEGRGIIRSEFNRMTETDRKPMYYDLKQLENKRKFLVDKFVVLNLIIVVLIELFIKK